MKNDSKAKDCGQRLRRIRMARNMSQQDLADKLFTTAQNISKYEKEGINNIDIIMKINETLDCNLLKDEMDEEGTIGEVGKEILCVLVEHNGFIEVTDLIKIYMHGLAAEQVTKEIVKLEKIGLCVREQYVGHYKDEHDGLFITAKGLISLKNNLNPAIAAMLFSEDENKTSEWLKKNVSVHELQQTFMFKSDSLKTYEQIVQSEGYETYQDYLDSMELQRLVCELPMSTYRANYIWYLKQNYVNYIWFGKNKFDNELESMLENYGDFLSGENAYVDTLHRMSQDLSNDLLERVFDAFWFDRMCGGEPIEVGICEQLILKYAPEYEEYRNTDNKKVNALKHFAQLSEWYKNYVGEIPGVFNFADLDEEAYCKLDKSIFTPEDRELAEQYERYQERSDEEYYITDVLYESRLANKAKDKNSKFITEWFEEEEIREFININLAPASNDEERKIDDMIAEINAKFPETLDYFDFPDEWEENGIASLIRHNFNIE